MIPLPWGRRPAGFSAFPIGSSERSILGSSLRRSRHKKLSRIEQLISLGFPMKVEQIYGQFSSLSQIQFILFVVTLQVMAVRVSQQMGMGFALGIYLPIICMVIAIGARMECGPRVGKRWG